MTHSDKVKALIEKAIEGGWSPTMYKSRSWTVDDILHWYMIGKFSHRAFDNDNYLKFIFNHDFAKSLFPQKGLYVMLAQGRFDDEFSDCMWKFHLQRAVISKDPITYLYDAVFGEK